MEPYHGIRKDVKVECPNCQYMIVPASLAEVRKELVQVIGDTIKIECPHCRHSFLTTMTGAQVFPKPEEKNPSPDQPSGPQTVEEQPAPTGVSPEQPAPTTTNPPTTTGGTPPPANN